MTPRTRNLTRLARAITAGAAVLSLAACARPSAGGRSARDAAAVSGCREQADRVYAKQNRAELYRSDTFATSNRDAPFAASGLPGITSRGLSGEYARDTLLSDCLGAGSPTGGGATSPALPSP